MIDATQHVEMLPGYDLRADKMPGHWLLARLGKRVLRPGGLAMTRALLADLHIAGNDDVVELAPGLGVTARMILNRRPHSYVGIERDEAAASWTARRVPQRPEVAVRIGQAEETGLADQCASVVIGEAMLSMNPPEHKQRIVSEAYRVLRPGGRYAIHELAIVPDEVPPEVKQDIEKALSAAIHVGARPLTPQEWSQLLQSAGFSVEQVRLAPMNLLRPARLIADEGLWGALRFIKNVARDGDARRRVLTMRRTFHRHRAHLSAISLIARK
jgi:ubiquinone/menaquinone biosynthesis C-methylase UbiE